MKLLTISDFFAHSLWWLFFWMLLSFLLGWLLSRLFRSKINDCCDELEDCKRRYADLEIKYNTYLKEVESAKVAVAPITTATGSAYIKLKDTNLQIIEGIGPKMEKVLQKNKITNWSLLAGKKATELRTLLDMEDKQRYQIIDPTTWPDQAQLAVDAKWQELIKMQKNLDAGRTTSTGKTDSKLEKIMIRLGLMRQWKQDDLKAIEGIGPKIEKLFHKAGIKTWKDLAGTPVAKLKEILASDGDRFKLADPDTWPKQAQLANEGKWDELQEYQDLLIGGK